MDANAWRYAGCRVSWLDRYSRGRSGRRCRITTGRYRGPSRFIGWRGARQRGFALPNGYCTLPLQQKCEFANACLTCPVFVTTAEFLPQHRRQLEQTQALIAQGDSNNQHRLAEMNRTVEKNLLAIIDGLTTGGGGGCCCCCSGGGGTACTCTTTGAPNAS